MALLLPKILLDSLATLTNKTTNNAPPNLSGIRLYSWLTFRTISKNIKPLIINKLIENNNNINIIVYGENSNSEKIFFKYEQLKKLGFTNVYVYTGGLFEWLSLQDIYGFELFPTTSKELDILKYKSKSIFNTFLLKN